ncbi:MBL fold metallo-hydrolase [Ruegeria marisrubri]|uniref:MBL fold metallo-hydrolase n=1 Tax=Ruegeria marisrubri TaxID=1685379 RepID=A0A0X3TKQ6_9RHOB|nr:MBL fold metallo-hydrolase [Ruegeria marisrubri]KUJ76239.1 MBL fold metallo-hydrolase [Ruegeria marisrubri]
MNLNRRAMLTGTGAALAVLAARPLWATSEVMLGNTRILSLSDGHLTLPRDFIFAPMPQEELAPILTQYGLGDGPLTPPCNITLMQSEDRVVLFDAGSGLSFQDTAGKLPDALDSVGLSPEDVTHVVFTHGHPDHLWGVLDDFDEPLFANAEHMMGKAEWEYWLNPNTVNEIESARTTMAVGAKRRLEVLEDAITLFEDGQEILPGVAAHATFGHTPGHMSFELRSGSEAVFVTGDAIGNHHVAFARPDWHSGSDQDKPTAAATRVRLMDKLASEQIPIIGFHLPSGGLGHVERKDDAYRFVPRDS